MGRLVELKNERREALTVYTEPLGEGFTLQSGSRLRITSATVDLGDIFIWARDDDLVVETQGGGDFSGVQFDLLDNN